MEMKNLATCSVDRRVWYPIIMIVLQNNASDWLDFLSVRLSVYSCLRGERENMKCLHKQGCVLGVLVKESKLVNFL